MENNVIPTPYAVKEDADPSTKYSGVVSQIPEL